MKVVETCTLVAAMALGLAACSNTPVAPAPVVDKPVMTPAPAVAPPPTPPATAAATPKAAPTSSVTTNPLPAYLDPNSSISTQRSVYFDFDVYTLRGEDTPLIERHGKYLAQHGSVTIKIEGNTDERGGTEYNLALGQRRAESVLRALKIYGVRDAQMEAVSWGESRPRAGGHDEASWAQNRRADIVYPSR